MIQRKTSVATGIEPLGKDLVWSRYNKLFHSSRLGYFVYNALSNSLFELDAVHYGILERLCDGGNALEVAPEFMAILRKYYVLTTGEEEELALDLHRQRRNAKNHESSRLGLTICPTLQCNFRCPYCFENSQGDPRRMSSQTRSRLIDFIKGFKEASHLSLAWYGGEPLMGFDVICSLTDAFRSLDLTYGGATLVTNGYLMDRRKCDLFNDLDIHSVQITIDGPEEMHDKRRFLLGGHSTFRRILDNVDTLLNSTFKGACDLRVNIDRENAGAFHDLEHYLLDRFKSQKVRIYAARVTSADGYDSSNLLSLREWTEFNRQLSRASNFVPTSNFYPSINLDSVCVATSHSRFVVGPRGELYKCWEDVGNPARVIGDVSRPGEIVNPDLYSQYTVGADAYSDPECLQCAVLPICGGGCANMRLASKYFGDRSVQYCSPFKEDLLQYLEEYIDIYFNQEMCSALLGSNLLSSNREIIRARGFRNITPKERTNCDGGSCSRCS